MTGKGLKKGEIAPEAQIENALNTTEAFIEKNGKKMLIALSVIIVLVGGYFAYRHLHKAPQETKAAAEIYSAQRLFEEGYYLQACNGDDTTIGFIAVANKYSSTASGNVANHYAGICLLNTGEYQKAIEFLQKYKNAEGDAAQIINAQNKGLIGDAYVQLSDYNKALSFYEMAVKESDNPLTAPYYTLKCGQVYEMQGNKEKALECYKKIKTDYYQSIEARDIDKYIGRVSY